MSSPSTLHLYPLSIYPSPPSSTHPLIHSSTHQSPISYKPPPLLQIPNNPHMATAVEALSILLEGPH